MARVIRVAASEPHDRSNLAAPSEQLRPRRAEISEDGPQCRGRVEGPRPGRATRARTFAAGAQLPIRGAEVSGRSRVHNLNLSISKTAGKADVHHVIRVSLKMTKKKQLLGGSMSQWLSERGQPAPQRSGSNHPGQTRRSRGRSCPGRNWALPPRHFQRRGKSSGPDSAARKVILHEGGTSTSSPCRSSDELPTLVTF